MVTSVSFELRCSHLGCWRCIPRTNRPPTALARLTNLRFEQVEGRGANGAALAKTAGRTTCSQRRSHRCRRRHHRRRGSPRSSAPCRSRAARFLIILHLWRQASLIMTLRAPAPDRVPRYAALELSAGSDAHGVARIYLEKRRIYKPRMIAADWPAAPESPPDLACRASLQIILRQRGYLNFYSDQQFDLVFGGHCVCTCLWLLNPIDFTRAWIDRGETRYARACTCSSVPLDRRRRRFFCRRPRRAAPLPTTALQFSTWRVVGPLASRLICARAQKRAISISTSAAVRCPPALDTCSRRPRRSKTMAARSFSD